MAEAGTLHDASIDELRDAYNAERQLTKARPKMAKAATNPDLRAAFETHLQATKDKVSKLVEVFGLMEEKMRSKPCEGIAGIID